MYCCRQFNRELDRLVVHNGRKFQLGKLHFSPLVRLQHQIPRDHYANGKTRPDRQGRLDVQIAPGHIGAELGDVPSNRAPGGLRRRWISEDSSAPRLRELEGCAEGTG